MTLTSVFLSSFNSEDLFCPFLILRRHKFLRNFGFRSIPSHLFFLQISKLKQKNFLKTLDFGKKNLNIPLLQTTPPTNYPLPPTNYPSHTLLRNTPSSYHQTPRYLDIVSKKSEICIFLIWGLFHEHHIEIWKEGGFIQLVWIMFLKVNI